MSVLAWLAIVFVAAFLGFFLCSLLTMGKIADLQAAQVYLEGSAKDGVGQVCPSNLAEPCRGTVCPHRGIEGVS